MDIISPVFNILHTDFIRRVDRERPRYILRPAECHAPGICYIQLSSLRRRAGHHKGMEQKLNRLILIDKPLRLSIWFHAFNHILFRCQHIKHQILSFCQVIPFPSYTVYKDQKSIISDFSAVFPVFCYCIVNIRQKQSSKGTHFDMSACYSLSDTLLRIQNIFRHTV